MKIQINNTVYLFAIEQFKYLTGIPIRNSFVTFYLFFFTQGVAAENIHNPPLEGSLV